MISSVSFLVFEPKVSNEEHFTAPCCLVVQFSSVIQSSFRIL